LNKESTLLTAKGIRYFNERFRTKVQSLYPEEELPPEAIGTCLHLDLIARSKARSGRNVKNASCQNLL